MCSLEKALELIINITSFLQPLDNSVEPDWSRCFVPYKGGYINFREYFHGPLYGAFIWKSSTPQIKPDQMDAVPAGDKLYQLYKLGTCQAGLGDKGPWLFHEGPWVEALPELLQNLLDELEDQRDSERLKVLEKVRREQAERLTQIDF
jgi:hypothetical protein